MAENSEYLLEPLREGARFTVNRGRERGNPMPILALAVAAEQPSPSQSPRRLNHEYSLALNFGMLGNCGRRVRRAFALTASVLFVALALCVPLFGLEPNSDISQYAHTSWKIRDGFLPGFVLSIAQTPDGYLWLGTERGLFRFDGVRAIPWTSLTQQQLPSSYVAALLAAGDGTLWIGTGKGLASWKAGKLTVYPELAGHLVQALQEDGEGTLWAGGFAYTPPGTLCAIRSGTAHCYGEDGKLGNGVLGLYEDSRRNLWAGVLNGFWRWKPGPPQFYPIRGEPYGIQHFSEDRDGSLLIPIAGSIARLRNGEIETADRLPSTKHQGSGERILRDRDGALWVGTWSQGLVHLREGIADRFAQRDGLSGDLVTALFEDREGNIWVGTTKGLDRFGAYSATTFSEQQGLSGGGSASVLAARDGSIWFSPHSQLYRFDRGQVTTYHQPGAGIEPIAEEGERRVREVTVAGLPGLDVVSLFQDHQGRIWVAGTGGVGYLQNDRFVSINSVPGGVVDAMSGDSKGNLWISIVDRGLFHLFEDKLVQHIPWEALGRNDLATVLAVDPSIGGVWLGFSKGGLARLAEGQTRLSFVTDPAIDKGRVSDLRFDHEGALWVASEGGLSRIKNGRISTLTTKSGLPCDHIYWLAQDQDDSFWLYGSCGLMRIARSNLDAWLATASSATPKSVRATLFDETDGVTLRGDPSAGPQGRAAMSPDGKIWFPTVDGLSVIDPHHLPFNPIPPPVHIEKIVADGKEYNLSSGLHLPAHARDLSIDYTALSYVAPEKIHFRYKLEGQDPNWREVVNDREVQYSNLPPGSYHFHVIACNNDGVWNETGAILDFSILPAFYQTTWFRILCVALFAGLLWALYQLRMRSIQRRSEQLAVMNAKLEAQIAENAILYSDLQIQVGLLQLLPVSAWTLKPDGTPDFVNRVWLEFSGQTLDFIRSSPEAWMAALHPEDREMAARIFWEGIHSGQDFAFETRALRAQDGTYRRHLQQAVVLRDAEGKVLKFVGTTTDIDDQKRIEEALRQAQGDLARINRVTTMGELAASLAHEVSQPISGAMTNANVCLRSLGSDQPDLDLLRTAVIRIARDAKRAADIIARIRSQFEKGAAKQQALDVNEIVRETAALLRDEAMRYNISIRTELATDLPQIVGDRLQLQQVAMNLIVNSIEAMKDVDRIRELVIKSQRAENEQILVSFSDTGPGFPPQLAEQIFDPFFTTKPHGTGMGLRISRSIVESHGGRLWAEAPGGRGATFYLSLPIAIPSRDPATPESIMVQTTGQDP